MQGLRVALRGVGHGKICVLRVATGIACAGARSTGSSTKRGVVHAQSRQVERRDLAKAHEVGAARAADRRNCVW